MGDAGSIAVVCHERAARPLELSLLKEDGAPDASVDVVFDTARSRAHRFARNEGREAQGSCDRIVGGPRHRRVDGSTGDAWHAVQQVSPSADMTVIHASYHARSKVRHPDNRATGDAAAMLRLNRAYAEARKVLGAD